MSMRDANQAAMEIIESMELKRGRGQANSVVSRSAAKASVARTGDQGMGILASAAPVTGPINRLMYLEARHWAVDLVTSLTASPIEVVVDRLAGATVGRPSSYVAGIRSVINELTAADVTGQRDNLNLTNQLGENK